MKTATVVCLWLLASLALAGTGRQPAHGPEPQLPPGHPALPDLQAQADWPKARPGDVGSLDAIVAAFYDSTAGEADKARDWDRLRSLFVPQGRLVAARPGNDGAQAVVLGVNDYIEANRNYFEKGGFFDREVARRVERFGNIAHVWSTYDSRRTKNAPEPYARGINSLQLLKDGDRWWIVTVFWDFERADNPIPDRYLHTPKD